MKVRVSRSVLNGFRQRALSKYPNEHLESIFGTNKSGEVHILAFFPVEHRGTPEECIYNPDDIEAQREHEDCPKCIGKWLGSIHSHPDAEPYPSEADWETARADGETIMGIYQILPRKKGRKQTKVRFFAEPVQELEVV